MAPKHRKRTMSVFELARTIGTVIAISVYTDQRGARSRQWRCWFDDATLVYTPTFGCVERRKMPSGYGATMDEAVEQFVRFLRGAIIYRDGHELTDMGQEWHVPQSLTT